MFTLDFSANIGGENIKFVDLGENSKYPSECFVTFDTELFCLAKEDLEKLEDQIISIYDNLSELHKDPLLLGNGIVHFTPNYPDDMNDSLRTVLAHRLKAEVREFILAHSIR